MDATGALHKNPDSLNLQMCVWNRSYRRPPVVENTAGIRPRVLLQVSKARTHFTKASEHLRAVCSCQRRLRDSHMIWFKSCQSQQLESPWQVDRFCMSITTPFGVFHHLQHHLHSFDQTYGFELWTQVQWAKLALQEPHLSLFQIIRVCIKRHVSNKNRLPAMG